MYVFPEHSHRDGRRSLQRMTRRRPHHAGYRDASRLLHLMHGHSRSREIEQIRRRRGPSPRSASRSSAGSSSGKKLYPTPTLPLPPCLPTPAARPPGIRSRPCQHPHAPMPAGNAPEHIRSPPCTRARTEAGAGVHGEERIRPYRASARADARRPSIRARRCRPAEDPRAPMPANAGRCRPSRSRPGGNRAAGYRPSRVRAFIAPKYIDAIRFLPLVYGGATNSEMLASNECSATARSWVKVRKP